MRRIAIVGVGRSGTAYITRFLGKCGVFLDEVNWAYEHELARLINDSILAQEFGAKSGLPYGKLPAEEIEPSDSSHRMAQFFIKYMDGQASMEDNTLSWAFKDPRTTILHRIWLDHFDAIVGMFRAPQEVVASYLGQGWVRGFRKGNLALGYWKRFNQSLLHIYRTYEAKKSIYILDYNEDMSAQTMLLCKKLGVEPTEDAKSLFDPSLKHYIRTDFPKDELAIKIYEGLQAIRMMRQ